MNEHSYQPSYVILGLYHTPAMCYCGRYGWHFCDVHRASIFQHYAHILTMIDGFMRIRQEKYMLRVYNRC